MFSLRGFFFPTKSQTEFFLPSSVHLTDPVVVDCSHFASTALYIVLLFAAPFAPVGSQVETVLKKSAVSTSRFCSFQCILPSFEKMDRFKTKNRRNEHSS